jgi:hypothetical protein
MAAIIRVTPPLMKSRFRVLALRLAPLNYMMRSPLDFALTREGVDPFFWCRRLCPALVGLSLGHFVAAIAGTSGESTSIWYRSNLDRFYTL